MKKIISLVITAALLISACSQNDIPEFGRADLKELLMKECEFDKDAPAVKLLDYRVSEFSVNFNIWIETERRVRVKIFNQKGYNYAIIKIPYDGRKRSSKITDIIAYIYNLDSQNKPIIQKIEKKEIFKEKSNENTGAISFTFPNLKPGSVIEYRYKKTDRNSVYMEPWFFQDKIPTLYSICKIIKPSAVELDARFITKDSVRSNYSSREDKYIQYLVQTYQYSLKNIPAFSAEPLTSSVKDNLQRAEFALMPVFQNPDSSFSGKGKWQYFNLMLLSAPYFGQQIYEKIPGAHSIIDSARLLKTIAEKTNFIYEKVKSKIYWNRSRAFYTENKLAEVWEAGTGTSAEINLILLNLLRKAGISSFPALVSTKDNGKPDRNFISLSQFNGVDILVKDDSVVYVLDGANKFQLYNNPPLNILNRSIFIVDPDNSKWVTLYDSRALLKNVITGKGKIDMSGTLTGEASRYFYDLLKTQMLYEKNNPDEDEEDDKEFIEKSANDVKIDSLVEEDAENALKPLNTKFKFEYKLSRSGDFYFIDPFFLASFRKNPFTDSMWRTEIDFGANQYYTTSLYIDVPENMTIEELPENKLLRTPDSSMIFKRILSKHENSIRFKTTLEFSRTVFYPDEYEIAREFFRKMYGMIGEQIVLKKKR